MNPIVLLSLLARCRAACKSSMMAAVLLTLGVCGAIPSLALAQYSNPRTFQIISAGKNGLTRGQTLRYVWTNLADPAVAVRNLSVRLLTSEGHVIAQREAAAAHPGQFQWFEFDRDQIPLPGEPDTNRLQVRLEATIRGDLRGPDSIPALLGSFDDAAEIVDTLSGRTLIHFKPKEIAVVISTAQSSPAPGGPDSLWIDLGSVSVGFTPEQTLRVTVLNPFSRAPEGDGRKYKMLFAFTILDAEDRVVARADEIGLDPGESHSFDVRTTDLAMAGEPGTGRLQVRCEIERRYFQGIAARVSQGASTGVIELIDNHTGETVLLLPAAQTAHEAGRTRQP